MKNKEKHRQNIHPAGQACRAS